MKFRVLWAQDAEQSLANIWLRSRFRSRITDAAQFLDQQLERDPYALGESREAGFRVVFAPPLAARCYIDDTEQIAVVVQLWQIEAIG